MSMAEGSPRAGTILAAPPARLRPWIAALAALSGLIVFFHVRNAVEAVLGEAGAVAIAAVLGAATLPGIALARVGYDAVPPLLARLTRFSAAGIVAYLVVEPPATTLAVPEAASIKTVLDLAYWPALAAAVAALWRPGFVVLPCMLVVALRHSVETVSGLPLSTLDVRYMLEMAMTLGLAAGLIGAAGPRLDAPFRTELAHCAAFAAIGLHLTNYFWSGVAKLLIGPEPWSWALDNATPYALLAALDRGVLPSAPLPWMTGALYDGFMAVYPLSNAFVLLTQLAAIALVARLAWLRLGSLAYDALHVGIWLFGGLFFWPWIWNNLSILVAIRGESGRSIAIAPRVVCVLVILFGASPKLADAALLAWWDVPEMKHPALEARAGEDAPWVRVPLSFWLSHSHAVSHGYQDLAVVDGHYTPTIWGSSKEYRRHLSAGTCPAPAIPADFPEETTEERDRRLARVGAFVRAHHAKMADRQARYPAPLGVPWYYWRSHHHPSVPWVHRDFHALDLGAITHYRLVTRSLCLSLDDAGRLERRVRREDEVIFDVR